MDRKITIVGIEEYDFKTRENETLKMANIHYQFQNQRVKGIACGRVTVSQKMLDRYNIQLNAEYIGAFYLDANKREKLAALFEEA